MSDENQNEMNGLAAVAEQILGGSISASTTITNLVLMQAEAAHCRKLVAEWTEHQRNDDGSDNEFTKLIAQALPHWKSELQRAEQKVRDYDLQNKNRN